MPGATIIAASVLLAAPLSSGINTLITLVDPVLRVGKAISLVVQNSMTQMSQGDDIVKWARLESCMSLVSSTGAGLSDHLVSIP